VDLSPFSTVALGATARDAMARGGYSARPAFRDSFGKPVFSFPDLPKNIFFANINLLAGTLIFL